MKITITGRKVSLRDHFKDLAAKKLSRFDRIFDEDAEAKVVVTVLKNRQTVEITIRSRGIFYRAESTADEMNVALDNVIDALSRQIRKNKARLEKRIHISAISDTFQELPEDREEEPDEYKVVRTKHFFVKPMSVEEAILQMNLLEHQFFMFRNQEDNQINVVYRRKDGRYGLLTPDGE
ncbi:MAG: ribosome-associated translation inhibitor RaiA [Oscillospiraceae bacterium]|jgi:putative sigma-54 modulation protein|nr:ribosome-associated translation inhibitor RaiA [Oscillospiraceae bacterium]